MNKIASYLNEHLLGEVTSAQLVRKYYSTDASILSITPEAVVFPRTTNDVRKVARFTWQLAEKGHVIGLTPRGFGTDTTGAAIGKGVIINMSAHLNNILQIATKERLVHVQAGIRVESLQQTLKWQGLSVAELGENMTIGGAIAGDAQSSSGAIGDNIERLEVILANGDIMETGRISRREVSKKLGLQTLEGEIYRKLSGLIEDNQDLIKRIASDETRDNTGYRRITQVKNKDGSFDLTPLFVGSQGTLGIVSEAVIRTEFFSKQKTVAAITTDSLASARDITDKIKGFAPSDLHIYDGRLFQQAVKEGARFQLFKDVEKIGAIIYLTFSDFSDRLRSTKIKRIRKMTKDISSVEIIDSSERDLDEFQAIEAVTHSIIHNDKDATVIPIIDGSYVPADRREEFEAGLEEIAKKHHLQLPVVLNVLTGTYRTFPELRLNVVSDKQKLFRLVTDYAALVDNHNGAFVSDGAEGRIKANAAWGVLDEDEAKLFEQVREIFDPFGTLNPGVKQKNELRTLVASLRSSYDTLRHL